MSGKNVFVVGGGGYIGSQVVADLKEAGDFPIIIDNFSTGNRDIAARLGVPIEEGDIIERSFLSSLFAKYNPSSVMHFAAFAAVGESVTNPAKYYRNNVAGTLTLLETMLEHKVLKFIFSSTCATYGQPKTIPITEDLPLNPISPYGQSKLMVERILMDFERAYGLRSVIFRYFNAAGAHPTLPIGERHDPETHLIPRAILAAYGKATLDVFGSDYDTPDGTCIRDYIHIADISQAHLLGMKLLEGGGKSEIFNIGTGNGFSVNQVINEVSIATGRKVPFTTCPRRDGDPPRLIAGADKIRSVLGWKPTYPNLKEIVATAVAWHRRELGA